MTNRLSGILLADCHPWHPPYGGFFETGGWGAGLSALSGAGGGTYFFTVNLLERRLDTLVRHVDAWREAVRVTRQERPFHIDAWVVLPDHLHCVWTLPPGDKDDSMRWNVIKGHFSRHCPDKYKTPPSAAQQRKWAQTVWQPRYLVTGANLLGVVRRMENGTQH